MVSMETETAQKRVMRNKEIPGRVPSVRKTKNITFQDLERAKIE